MGEEADRWAPGGDLWVRAMEEERNPPRDLILEKKLRDAADYLAEGHIALGIIERVLDKVKEEYEAEVRASQPDLNRPAPMDRSDPNYWNTHEPSLSTLRTHLPAKWEDQ